MSAEMPIEVRDELCRKLRETVKECGQKALRGAVMIGPYDKDNVSNVQYITCPTISNETLGNVSYKTARAFEDA